MHVSCSDPIQPNLDGEDVLALAADVVPCIFEHLDNGRADNSPGDGHEVPRIRGAGHLCARELRANRQVRKPDVGLRLHRLVEEDMSSRMLAVHLSQITRVYHAGSERVRVAELPACKLQGHVKCCWLCESECARPWRILILLQHFLLTLQVSGWLAQECAPDFCVQVEQLKHATV